MTDYREYRCRTPWNRDMSRNVSIRALAVIATIGAFALAGCQTDRHAMTRAQPGVKPVCRECYELATQYLQWYPLWTGGPQLWRQRHSGPRWRVPHSHRPRSPMRPVQIGGFVLHRERRPKDQVRQVRA